MTGRQKEANDAGSVEDEGAAYLVLLGGAEDEDTGLIERTKHKRGASFAGAVFNLSTCIIGAGIMALPATMKVMGIILGVAAMLFVAWLSDVSVDMLLRFSRAGGSSTYEEVMADAFGKIGRIVLLLCVVINNVGMLMVYLIIIGDVLCGKTTASGTHRAGVLEGLFGVHWWTGRAFVLLVMTLTVLVPLAMFKRIDSLRSSSAVAVALAIIFVVITAGITIVKLINGSIAAPRLLPSITDANSLWKLFTVIPVIVAAYVCHYNVHYIGNELEASSSMKAAVLTSLVLCSIIYIMTSLCGYLLFGDSTLDDVLVNFDTNLGIPFSSELNYTVRISYGLHVLLVFPVMLYALRRYLDCLLFPSASPLELNNFRFTLMSAGLLCLSYVGANFIPSIWDAFQFIGTTTGTCLGFIFPAAISLRDAHGIASRKDKIMSVVMICLAVFSSSVVIYSNAHALIKEKPSPVE